MDGLADLLRAMAASIDWPHALLRGRYMSAVARMERSGVPVDAELYRTFIEQWPNVQDRLIEEIDPDYGVYGGWIVQGQSISEVPGRCEYPLAKASIRCVGVERRYFQRASPAAFLSLGRCTSFASMLEQPVSPRSR